MSEINYMNRNIFITFMQYFMEPILFLLLNAILDIFFQTWKRKIFIIFRLQQTTTFIDNMS